MQEVKINTEYITLVQLLKMVSLINSGGEITYFLEENEVYYNGVLETRKRKKLYPGDEISINNQKFIIC